MAAVQDGHYQTLSSVLIHLQCLQPLYRRFTPPNRHDAASTGRDSGQGNQMATGRLAAWGSNTHQRLATCEPSRAPVLDCGPNPSFRSCDSGPGSRLTVLVLHGKLQISEDRRVQSWSRASKMAMGNMDEHDRIHQSSSDDSISQPSPHRCPNPSRCRIRTAPGSGNAASPTSPPVEVQWNRRVTVCSSARLLVYSSTRLLPSATRLSLGSV